MFQESLMFSLRFPSRFCLLAILLCASVRAQTPGQLDLVERQFKPDGWTWENPWEDVNLRVQLISPTNRPFTIGGFYVAPGIWMFRFAPDEAGPWTLSAELTSSSQTQTLQGTLHPPTKGQHRFIP